LIVHFIKFSPLSQFVLWGVLSGINPNPRTTYLAIAQHAWKSKDFTHSNSNLHCGFVKLNWSYLLKHLKKIWPHLNLLLNINIIHHKLGWIDAYSPILSILQFVIDFLEKTQHAIDTIVMVVFVILEQVTSLLVLCPPFSVGHLLLKVLYWIKFLLNHLTWFFKNPPWDQKKIYFIYLRIRPSSKDFFKKLIKMLLQMPLMLKHQITKRIRDVIVVGRKVI
jgi:hypothetical protein